MKIVSVIFVFFLLVVSVDANHRWGGEDENRTVENGPEQQRDVGAVVRLAKKFRKKHALSVGDKGEDWFDLSAANHGCEQNGWVFDRVELDFVRRRFADAKIVQQPQPGCIDCKPVVVRWFNEPTGVLVYELSIYERKVDTATDGERHCMGLATDPVTD